ncbi:hypothetical protein NEOLEDRAFT_1141861 [Neolentinus lepideus HHB14362 ss-1]|uniref:Uncharacterized protein n=1 Tax=Neolentinus lepideus HHB14362 ss-1 TaxID=1314782 RepID=A0A165NGC9_9AGAM|nr:hypothetical protein NEOLEDRAFT_1141861 [Neolentinus lepideus HHB14362 ss-1]
MRPVIRRNPQQLRVALVPALSPSGPSSPADLRLTDPHNHWATLRVNRRIMAPDWWQDVLLEFNFDKDVQCVPPPLPSAYYSCPLAGSHRAPQHRSSPPSRLTPSPSPLLTFTRTILLCRPDPPSLPPLTHDPSPPRHAPPLHPRRPKARILEDAGALAGRR